MSFGDILFDKPIELDGPVPLWRRRPEQRDFKTNRLIREAGPRKMSMGSFTIRSLAERENPSVCQDVLHIDGAPTGFEGFYLGRSAFNYVCTPTHWTCNAGSYVYDECRIHKDEMFRIISFWAGERGIDKAEMERHHQEWVAYIKQLRGE